LQFFDSFVIVACVTSNSYGYIQDEAVDRIFNCVAKWKSYARILSTFFVNTNETNIATCFLWYFNPCSIVDWVYFQQFWLHANIGSIPYSRLCGKIKVLLSHFQ